MKPFSLQKKLFLILLSLWISIPAIGQQINGVTTTATSIPIIPAASFLNINTAPSSAGMGEIGVVASPFNYQSALQHNPALLAREKQVYGGHAVFTPWLRALGIPNMAMYDVEGFGSISPNQALGIKFRYFSVGNIFLFAPPPFDDIRPEEIRAGLSYALQFSDHFSMGFSLNYFFSNLPPSFPNSSADSPVRSFSGDLGLDYRRLIHINETVTLRINIAGALLHIGPKVDYVVGISTIHWIPATLRTGGMLTAMRSIGKESFIDFDAAMQLDKLLIPSEGAQSELPLFRGMVTSLFDAPGGFSEELDEWVLQLGGEFRYRGPNQLLLAIRNGYFLESAEKGNRRYMTLGLGAGYRGFRLDGSFIVPFQRNHPLQNTVRIGLGYVFLVDSE